MISIRHYFWMQKAENNSELSWTVRIGYALIIDDSNIHNGAKTNINRRSITIATKIKAMFTAHISFIRTLQLLPLRPEEAQR